MNNSETVESGTPLPPGTVTERDAETGKLRLISVPGPDSAVWDVPWLADLRDVPENATWPRLMTLPHPRAVGSYGLEVEEQFRARTGREPRWWQRLAWRRILEHDEAGNLVWLVYLLTLARQVGKSWGLRELNLWRVRQTGRWGPQLVMHTGKDLAIVQEVMLPAMSWAERQGLPVTWTNGRWELSSPGVDPETGQEAAGRWLGRAHRGVYGYSCTAGMVDEGWKVPPRAVDDGLLPTMVEQLSPQLGLISTAHPEATGLMIDRRGSAIVQLFAPVDALLLDWSSPPGLADDDERGWRMASPHWSDQRRQLIAGALEAAREGISDPENPDPWASFRAQWLNRWPRRGEHVAEVKDEPLAERGDWDGCLDETAQPAPGRPIYTAVEDNQGRGAAAAAAALTGDGGVVVGGHLFDTLREAVDWAQDTAEASPDGLLLAGASLVGDSEREGDPELEGLDLPVEPAGQAEFRDGLPTLRALILDSRLAHDGGEDVTRAVVTTRVRPSTASSAMLVTTTESMALIRALTWAAQRAHRDRE